MGILGVVEESEHELGARRKIKEGRYAWELDREAKKKKKKEE
jgi:hypothetical protein